MRFDGKWRVLVNPAAAGGRAGSRWHATAGILREIGLDFSPVFTANPGETKALALASVADGFPGLAVYGGDGTLSTVASAISELPSPPILGQIPAGSGNDWIRTLGISQNTREAAMVLLDGCTRKVDTGLCVVDGLKSLFINSAGIGFDALVLRRTLGLRKTLPLRKSGYLVSLAFSALVPPRWNAEVYADGRVLVSGEYFTLTIGVGRFSGGGMSLSPDALIDDGLLDAVTILPVGLSTIARNLSRVFDGSLMKLRQARADRAETITVIPHGEILLEMDGEYRVFPSPPESITFNTGPVLRVAAPRS